MINLFRDKAKRNSMLDEQLDKALVVTPPSLWLAIITGIAIIVVVLIWSIFGRMPVNVTANGIYVPDQNSYTLASEVSGIVKNIDVNVGDEVKVGDTLYTIDTTPIQKEISDIEDRIKNVESITTSSRNDVVNSDTQSLVEIKLAINSSSDLIKQNEYLLNLKQENADSLESDYDSAKSKYSNIQKDVDKYQTLLTKLNSDTDLLTKYNNGNPSEDYDSYISITYGVDSRKSPEEIKAIFTNALESSSKSLAEAQSEYSLANQLLNSANNEITSIEQQLDVARLGREQTVNEYIQKFNVTKELVLFNLNSQLEKYKDVILNNNVISSVNGYISDIKVSIGSAVSQGSSTVTIRETKDDDIVICYVGIQNGKKIKEGMSVKIYPSIVNKNEYGNIEAVVLSVDNYVTTTSQIRSDLGDDTLTQAFASQGPVIGVKCKLLEDKNTASGYKWSSKKAQDITIPQGTIVSADIIVEQKKPISMLVPYLKDKLENFTQSNNK